MKDTKRELEASELWAFNIYGCKMTLGYGVKYAWLYLNFFWPLLYFRKGCSWHNEHFYK